MIDTHYLAYAGVLLVFFTGAAIVAATAVLLLGTGFLTALASRIIRNHAPHMLSVPARKAGKPQAVVSMEEALRQVAASKAAPTQARRGTARGSRAPLHLADRRCAVPRRRQRAVARATTAA